MLESGALRHEAGHRLVAHVVASHEGDAHWDWSPCRPVMLAQDPYHRPTAGELISMLERVTDGLAPMESRRNLGLLASLRSFNVPKFFSSRSLKSKRLGGIPDSSAGTPQESPASSSVARAPGGSGTTTGAVCAPSGSGTTTGADIEMLADGQPLKAPAAITTRQPPQLLDSVKTELTTIRSDSCHPPDSPFEANPTAANTAHNSEEIEIEIVGEQSSAD